nr:immunoglobulin light chain junction region [Macaca mulatta]
DYYCQVYDSSAYIF